MQLNNFKYTDERFADIQMLRYRLNGFENLTFRQKMLVFCLAKAALFGRDITFDQQGKYNLRIRKTLEAVFVHNKGNAGVDTVEQNALETYLKRVWFSNGIYHHYGCEKLLPTFSKNFLEKEIMKCREEELPLRKGETKEDLCREIFPVIFDETCFPKRVNKADGEDLVATSACNFYENVTQQEVEDFYSKMKADGEDKAPSYGLNSKLVKRHGEIQELTWKTDGLYGEAIKYITSWLQKSLKWVENEQQRGVIELLIKFYNTGDLRDFDKYSIEWVSQHDGMVDFINGFIEVYGDPLGLKGTWEALVEYKDLEATKRTRLISDNAQWFEDHSPVDPRFRKQQVKGVVANVICAAMLGGEEYPSSAIGINLPNADWIRAEYGSKSVTIGNLTEAYNKAARGNGFKEEFVIDEATCRLIDQYGDVCDDLHTDLHECLGHGSGQLLPGTDPDALKAYGNTIEEARADLFGLYYIADDKLIELGLVPNKEAYKSQYYTYMMNGLMTQTVRIKPGQQIEEAHMRNRALIAHWVLEHADGAVEMVRRDGKTFVMIHDYNRLRSLFGTLLAEIQRIKSEGDFEVARKLVEQYAIHIDENLHQEVLARYERLNLAPYKGFINPWMKPVYDENQSIIDIVLDYTESYEHQMLRYSREYVTLV